ncbi:hypothetical protein LguiA_017843 [Lonicera macranthoides]
MDRLSQLPDDILALILSYFGLKEAARTSALSRRWTGQWAFTNRLNFLTYIPGGKNCTKWAELNHKRHQYAEWINQVLKLHKSPILEEFKVYFDFKHQWESDIDKWLKFALARGVRILELDFSWNGSGLGNFERIDNYALPFNKSLRSSCHDVSVGSLKEPCFTCVDVNGEALEFLLSNCPLLERLIVSNSNVLLNVRVTNPCIVLKYLQIFYCKNIQSIEICNVNLVSFMFRGRITNSNLRLENVPLLVELRIWQAGSLSVEEDLFPMLPYCSHQLETLGFLVSIEGLQEFRGFHAPPVFSNLKKLVLAAVAETDRCVLGYISLLDSCPLLQKFVFEVISVATKIDKREVKKVSETNAKKHQHLEEVEMTSYYGRKCKLELVTYFVENAVSLKKIIIRPEGRDEESSQAFRNLLSFSLQNSLEGWEEVWLKMGVLE